MNCTVRTVSGAIIKCRGVRSAAAKVNSIPKRTFGANAEDVSTVAGKGNWSKVIKDAEKIVGYSTSFLNLRWIMTDEVANVALHLRQLVGTGHPLLTTAKNILYEEQNNVQLWGLAILLLANAVKSHNKNVQNKISIQDDDVFAKHRMLAELTEMIKTGHLIHQSIVDLPNNNLTKKEERLRLGNKIGLLTGDYLLVKANSLVAQLRNQDLTILISSAMRDLSVAEFVGDRGPQNIPIPSRPKANLNDFHQDIVTESYYDLLHAQSALGNARSEWTTRSILTGGSLLGRGCQSAMLLSNQPESVQAAGYMFGCHLALAWQSASEIKKIISPLKEQFSLVSAPVLFALESYPEWYKYVKVAFRGINNFNFEEFKVNINSSDAIEKTKDLCRYHSQRANSYLNKLGDNDAIRTLRQVVAVV